MAAPMVTGTAAMLYSYDASLSLMDVRNRILQSRGRLRVCPAKWQPEVCWMPGRDAVDEKNEKKDC